MQRSIKEQLQKQLLEQSFSGPRCQKIAFRGKTFRILWNGIDIREPTETFHEYLIDVLKRTFGQEWIDRYKRPHEEGHVVMRWIYRYHELAQRAMPPDHEPGQVFSMEASGDAKALVKLADDLYRLQLLNRLPDRVLGRLRHPEQFQGARYEVAVASMFARCNFEIAWIDDKATEAKHPEFTATHKATKEVIAVEAKSRHRPGVLNVPGDPSDLAAVGADVDRIFKKALAKDPGDRPFAIFIDLNLPGQARHSPTSPWPWLEDMKRVIDAGPPGTAANPSPYNLLSVTNYSWHYDASAPAGSGEFLVVTSPYARSPFRDARTMAALQREIQRYGRLPPRDE